MTSILTTLKKNALGIILILIAAVMLSVGQLLWKFSTGTIVWLLLLGLAIYGIGAVFMILAYKNGRFSTIHPMMSTSYILAFIFGWLFLGEQIGGWMIAGLIMILAGNILIGGADD